MNDPIYLKYIGAGSYLVDVPARDLTQKEAEYHGVGRLLDSKLYARAQPEKPNTSVQQDTQYKVAEEKQSTKRGK